MSKTDFLEDIVNEFDEVINVSRNRLSERAFKEFFLPYMTGERVNENITVKWIEVAGSPFLPVDLIDDNGNVVRTVPPLIKGAVDAKEGEFNNIDSMIVEGKLQEEVYGIDTKSQGVSKQLKDPMETISMNKDWEELFSIYGAKKTVQKEHTSSIDDEDDIILDFD